MEMKITQTKEAPAAIGPYSQAIAVNGVLYASGQIPIEPVSGHLVEGGIALQAEQVMQNIRKILEANGIGFMNVVKATCFLTDMADFSEFNQIYEKYFVSKPARSCVAVKELPKHAACEVEIIAVL